MNPADDERLDWNSEASKESEGFKVLPEGTEVNFTVVEFKKATSKNGANMAKLELKCETDDGLSATLREYLVLLRSCEWKINQFFTCVGLRKHGERSVPKWNEVLGSKGRAKLGVEKWESRDGKIYDVNIIKSFLEPPENPTSKPSTSVEDDDEDLF